ncbi:MAG: hypothetical protein ACRCZS_13150 [Chroococcidiopsis sp.]
MQSRVSSPTFDYGIDGRAGDVLNSGQMFGKENTQYSLHFEFSGTNAVRLFLLLRDRQSVDDK